MKKIIFTILVIQFSFLVANAQWVPVLRLPNGNPVQAFTDNGYGRLYTASIGNIGGVYSTSDNGLNWSFSNNGISSAIYGISAKDSVVFLSCQDGIYRSLDYGATFTHILNDIGPWSSKAVLIKENYVFAGFLSGIYRSTNCGNNWIQVNNGLPEYRFPISMAYSNNVIYIGIRTPTTAGIYSSTNFGDNWVNISNGIPAIEPYSLYSYSNLLMTGTSNGVYISTNYGNNWRLINEINGNIGLFGLTSSGIQNIFISAWNYGVFASTNGGLNWVTKNEGLFDFRFTAMYTYNNFVFLGTNPWGYYHEVLKRPVSEMVPVIENNTEIPDAYILFQNYPNPFNPATNIKYSIAKEGLVLLKIYDALGREMKTLANKQLQAGTYETNWNGSNFPSGIYCYSLFVNGIPIDTKKAILIK